MQRVDTIVRQFATGMLTEEQFVEKAHTHDVSAATFRRRAAIAARQHGGPQLAEQIRRLLPGPRAVPADGNDN